MKKDNVDNRRPLVVSAASVNILVLGSAGLLLGIFLADVVVLFLPYAAIPRFDIFFVPFFWVAAGPILILAGYNLRKMKKWAAQLAAGIVLFDLIAALFLYSLWSLFAHVGNILAWIWDVYTLVLIGGAWKHLH